MSKYLGEYNNLSNQEYHAAEGLSSTGLIKLVKQTPAHYKAYISGKRESTPAMRLGSAIHSIILEPHKFDKIYTCKPEGMNFATKEGKLWKEQHEGLEILSYDDYHTCHGIHNAVNNNSRAMELMTGSKFEQSIFVKIPNTEITLKCRPDILLSNGSMVDVKTTESADPRAFQGSISRYGMELAMCFYKIVMSLHLGCSVNDIDFTFLAIEKDSPYEMAFYNLDQESMARAMEDVRRGLEIYQYCVENNNWYGYGNDTQTLSVAYFGK